MGALFIGRRRDRNHLILAGVERGGHAPNRTSLPGRVPSFEEQDRRHPPFCGTARQLVELALIPQQFA